jgi:hypothetical protein
MAITNPPAEESTGTTDAQTASTTDSRPTYFSLGTDDREAHYCYETAREVVHVIHDGRRTHIYDCRGKTVDEFMAAVANTHEWQRRDYGLGVVGLIERAADQLDT